MNFKNKEQIRKVRKYDDLPEPLLLVLGWIGMIFCYPFIRKRVYIKEKSKWQKTHNFTMPKVCTRLGHTPDVFLKSYGSADIFNEKDRELIKKILGDLINGN